MPVTKQALDRLSVALRLEAPIIAIYDAAPGPEFEPMIQAKGRACCFAYYDRWKKGETLVVQRDTESVFANPQHGCPGLQKAFGLGGPYPPWMANFLTDGQGAPMGEGLKASPDLAQDFLDRAKPVTPSNDSILMGPLKLEQWEKIKSITFMVDPDRLAALMTLAAFWSSDPDEIAAPFSSGCGLMWRELENFDRDRAVIACTDLAMRKYVPSHIMGLTVSPARFEKMLTYPDTAFLNREWWNDLMDHRSKKG